MINFEDWGGRRDRAYVIQEVDENTIDIHEYAESSGGIWTVDVTDNPILKTYLLRSYEALIAMQNKGE